MEEGPEYKNWQNSEGTKICGENAKLIDFQKLKDLRFVKYATDRRQCGSHFVQGGLILPKLVCMALKLQIAKSQEEPISSKFVELENFQAMGRICPFRPHGW